MGLVFLPVYVHYLGIESYGLVGVFALLQTWLVLLDAGMSPTLGREMARFTAGAHSPQSIRNLLRTLEIVCVAIALAACAVIVATSEWLAKDWLKSERLPADVVQGAIALMALVVALRFVEGLYRAAIFGLQRQVWYNAVNAFLATLRNVGAVFVLASIAPTIGVYFVWQAAVSVLSVGVMAIGLHAALPRSPGRPVFSIASLRSVWRFAGGMTAITLLALLLTQVDKVILSRLLSLESFGYYTLAATVAGVVHLLIAPITTALYPHLVALVSQHDKAAVVDAYHRAAQVVTLMTMPVALLMAFHADGALFAWSGDAKLARVAGPILAALALGNVLNGLMHVPYQLQLAHGWTSFAIKLNVVAVVLLVPAILWVVPRYGAVGAAWVWIALNAGYLLAGIPLMHRRLLPTEKWHWYVRDIGRPTLGALGGLALTIAFKPNTYTDRQDWVAFLGVALLLALLGAGATLGDLRRLATGALRRGIVR
jgi:O-antigen/teichoic acid export membrane protein